MEDVKISDIVAVIPYAFTEHGVSMLASVLRSEKAVQMSIAVVRAFIALKQYVIRQDSLSQQLQEIRDRLGEHDVQLNSIYDAIENLLDEKVAEKKWKDRERIGFKK
jgi:phage regulator Rha-like protein